MGKGGIIRRFGLALVALILTAVLVVTEIAIIKNVSRFEPEVEVLYAKEPIKEDTVIEAGMIEMKKINMKYLHRLSIRSQNNAIGKKAKMDVEQGEEILSSKLGEEDTAEIDVLDRSKRLFSVAFSGDQANGWQVFADQYVDIIFIPGDIMKGGQQIVNSTGGCVFKNIRVAAVINENGRLFKNSEDTSAPKYISFELTEEQAEFLADAKGKGRLELSVVPDVK